MHHGGRTEPDDSYISYHSRVACDLVGTDILRLLTDPGYQGLLLEDGPLSQAVSAEATPPEFTEPRAWLVSELSIFCKPEENVQATNGPSEAEELQLEVRGLPGEMTLHCSLGM